MDDTALYLVSGLILILLLTGSLVAAFILLWGKIIKTGGYFRGFIHGFLFAEGEELPEEVLKRKPKVKPDEADKEV